MVTLLAWSMGQADACPTTAKAEPVRVYAAQSDERWTAIELRDMSASPDGGFIAAQDRRGPITILQAEDLLPLWTIWNNENGALSWSNSGDVLYQTRFDPPRTLRISTTDGTTTRENVARVAAGANTLVVGSSLEVRDAKDAIVAKLAWPGGLRKLSSLVASTDGTLVAATVAAERTAKSTTVIVWTPKSAREVSLDIAGATVGGLDVKNQRVLVAANWIDTAGKTTKLALNAARATLSPDGRRVLFSGPHTGVLDLGTNKTLWSERSAMPATFDATGQSIVSGDLRATGLTTTGPIVASDAQTGNELRRTGVRRYVTAMFLGDNALVTRTDDQITTWDLATGKRRDDRSRFLRNANVEVRGKDLIVTREGERTNDCALLRFFDVWTNGEVPTDLDAALVAARTITKTSPFVPPKKGASRTAMCVPRWSRVTAKRAIEKNPDGNGFRWRDLTSNKTTPLQSSDDIDRISLLGDYAFAQFLDGDDFAAAVWGPSGKRVLLPIPVRDDELVQFHGALRALRADFKAIAVSYGAHIWLYNPATGAALGKLDTASIPQALSYLGDNLLVGLEDGTTRLLTMTGKELARVDGAVSIVAMSPNGKRFAADGPAGIELWDSKALRKLVTFVERDGDNAWATLTPHGAFDGSDDAADLLSVAFGSPARALAMQPYEQYFRKPAIVAKRIRGADVDVQAALPRPPAIKLVDKPRVAGQIAHVKVHVESPAGGGEVIAYVEGRERARTTFCGRSTDVTLDVPVAETGRLTLAAADVGGAIHSTATDVVVASGKPRLWAVLVGIGEYSRLGPQWQLKADRDARGLDGALRAMATGSGLYAAEPRITTLVNGQATRAAIDKALQDLSNMQPGDQAIVYLAGHGWRLHNGKMVLITSKVATKAQAARDGISWEAIRDRLEAARGRVLVLLDACHSGAFRQDVAVANDRLASTLARRGKSGVVVFAAAKGHQYSFEVGASRGHFEIAAEQEAKPKRKRKRKAAPPPRDEINQDTPVGIFTSAVIATFASPASDKNRDGIIQLSELIASVRARVEAQVAQVNQQQTPHISHRDLFGDFAVGPRL